MSAKNPAAPPGLVEFMASDPQFKLRAIFMRASGAAGRKSNSTRRK